MALLLALDRRLEHVYRACGFIAAGLLITLTGLVLLSIVSRLISVFIPGLTELAGYSMAASAFFAMSYTFRSGGHIRVTLITGRFGPGTRRYLDIWCFGVFAFVTCYLAYYLGELVYDSWDFGEISERSDALPLWIPQLPMAIGAVIFAVSAIHTFIRALVTPGEMNRIDAGAGGIE